MYMYEVNILPSQYTLECNIIALIFNPYSNLRREQYLADQDRTSAVLMTAARTENIYDSMQSDTVDKHSHDTSLCAEMGTTKIDSGKLDGNYIKNE